MTVNGVIFQRRADGLWAWREGREYRGVDGDDWYLEDELWDVREQPWRALRDRVVGYLGALEERSHFDPGLLVAIDDPSWIRLYAEVSEALGVGYRMLLCETDLARPAMGDLGLECDFLGYDCAWPGGDYCSAVLCDLVGGRVLELSDVPLNANGLIPTREAAEVFLWRRERLKARYPESFFEGGGFVVYRLSEVAAVPSVLRVAQVPQDEGPRLGCVGVGVTGYLAVAQVPPDEGPRPAWDLRGACGPPEASFEGGRARRPCRESCGARDGRPWKDLGSGLVRVTGLGASAWWRDGGPSAPGVEAPPVGPCSDIGEG